MIKLAEYNPRQYTKEAKRRMRDNLKSVGLVGPALVWNKRTGNLVSGHLRLAALDICEGGTDYALDMTVVDWPPKKERQQNVFYNNEWAQGQFDLEALGRMLAEDLGELSKFGLDPVEIQHLFPGDERFGQLFADLSPENSTMPDAKAALDEIEADKDLHNQEAAELRKLEQADATKQQRKEYGAVMDAANAADFYVVVVCRDGAQCTQVLEALGTAHTGSRYVSAELVLRALQGEALPG